MPVMLTPEAGSLWIDPEVDDPAAFEQLLRSLPPGGAGPGRERRCELVEPRPPSFVSVARISQTGPSG